MRQNVRMEEEILRLAADHTTRKLIETLADRLSSVDPPALAAEFLALGEFRAAFNVALAGALRGAPPPAELAIRLMGTNENTKLSIALLGSVEEDLVPALIRSAGSDCQEPMLKSLVLFYAAALLDGQDPPPELLRRIRLTARGPLSDHAKVQIGLAALEVGDPHVLEVVGNLAKGADCDAGKAIRRDLLRRLRAPLLGALPEEAPPPDIGGFTIEKAAPKVGRNEPCPCGSGKKYKRCCLRNRKPDTPTADPAVPWGDRARFHRTMSEAQFNGLHPIEMARIKPEELTTSRLIVAIGSLSRYHSFEVAECFLEELVTRKDLPEETTLDEVRTEIARYAIPNGEIDLTRRLIESFDDPEERPTSLTLGLALLSESPDVLAQIEESALKSLTSSSWDHLGNLCAALIFFMPALGIIVSRGAIDPEHPLEAEKMLASVEEARDMLLLPPNDPAWEIYDLLSEQHVERELANSEAERSEKLAAEANRLRLSVAEARAKESAARRELERRERELAKATRAAAESQEVAARAQQGSGLSPEEEVRLRGKIEEFRLRIAEGNTKRRELRRQLSLIGIQMSDALRKDGGAEPEEEGDRFEVEAQAGHGHLALRIPVFSREFREELKAVAEHVARDAVATAGALAAADPGAWYSVKHVRSIEDLRSARIGRHRILFRLKGEDELTLLRLIHRKNLEVTLKKMG